MNWKRCLHFFAIACLILIFDICLKGYVHGNIPTVGASMPIYPYGGIGVFKGWQGIDFCIVHVMNKGAAWGAFAHLQEYLLYTRVAIIGALLAYLCFGNESVFRKFSLVLVTAGALGNVIDYFVYGHVVDMFYFVLWGYSFPVFNIADSVIFFGILFLLLHTFKFKRSSKSQPNESV
jgi:signal peptidase II